MLYLHMGFHIIGARSTHFFQVTWAGPNPIGLPLKIKLEPTSLFVGCLDPGLTDEFGLWTRAWLTLGHLFGHRPKLFLIFFFLTF